ncbi:formate dehydrogenase accessory protein [Ammonifex degensii KC4]|uniref:Formate dehydrogenase accessory protein n=1 Tax=Ammonifex degensii (strain DSM 10501 / KC4) TaxID=429009 RepID=C9R7M9_AMMDK|nr:formate dehydrogenase accessory protein FdhE [Ammonifex degensii]ACX52308.1 formate dehydrogenase accessory protein [Ammonifex degensii KC4]
MARDNFFPPQLITFYRELEKMAVPEDKWQVEEAKLKTWNGKEPLVKEAPPEIDPEFFLAFTAKVFDLLQKHLPDLGPGLELVKTNLPENLEEVKRLAQALCQRDPIAITWLKDPASVPPDVFGFAFSHVTRLLLGAYTRKVRGSVNFSSWERGECPVCGAKPLLARLKRTGERFLYCGVCGMEWRFVRVTCPFCGNDSPGELGFWEGAEGYRADVCYRCRAYLKTVDERKHPEEGASLFWEDIKTVALDFAMLGKGFQNKAFTAS